jgi:hypothetical protein
MEVISMSASLVPHSAQLKSWILIAGNQPIMPAAFPQAKRSIPSKINGSKIL